MTKLTDLFQTMIWLSSELLAEYSVYVYTYTYTSIVPSSSCSCSRSDGAAALLELGRHASG